MVEMGGLRKVPLVYWEGPFDVGYEGQKHSDHLHQLHRMTTRKLMTTARMKNSEQFDNLDPTLCPYLHIAVPRLFLMPLLVASTKTAAFVLKRADVETISRRERGSVSRESSVSYSSVVKREQSCQLCCGDYSPGCIAKCSAVCSQSCELLHPHADPNTRLRLKRATISTSSTWAQLKFDSFPHYRSGRSYFRIAHVRGLARALNLILLPS